MTPLRHLLLAFLAFTPLATRAESFTATVFEPGSERTKPLFRLELDERVSGTTTAIQARFFDLSGKLAVAENLTLERGQLSKYSIDQKQLGESGRIEPSGGKLRFSYVKDGRIETDTEDQPNNLILGPTTVEFVQAHWKEILAGEEVSARFAVPDRLETVGFKFFKDADTRWNGRSAVVVKMKPTSFVIAALVDPLYFTFDAENKRLVRLIGRTLPKRLDSGKWKDLDAEMIYEYPSKK